VRYKKLVDPATATATATTAQGSSSGDVTLNTSAHQSSFGTGVVVDLTEDNKGFDNGKSKTTTLCLKTYGLPMATLPVYYITLACVVVTFNA
jgi:hypothetical protein